MHLPSWAWGFIPFFFVPSIKLQACQTGNCLLIRLDSSQGVTRDLQVWLWSEMTARKRPQDKKLCKYFWNDLKTPWVVSKVKVKCLNCMPAHWTKLVQVHTSKYFGFMWQIYELLSLQWLLGVLILLTSPFSLLSKWAGSWCSGEEGKRRSQLQVLTDTIVWNWFCFIQGTANWMLEAANFIVL